MKIIILAAGKGVRLSQGEDNLPKPLTQLSNGKTILGYQIEALSRYFNKDDITIIVGFQKEEIIKRFSSLKFVHNDNYANENTAKSLLKGLQPVEDDVLWLNGDVVFYPAVLEQIVMSDASAMIVNKAKVGDEEIKYRTNEEGMIIEVSKQVVEGEGEAVGINFFKKKDLPILKRNLERCKDQDYFEKGIEYCLQEGVEVKGLMIDENHCAEIDFPSDLERVNKMLKGWGQSASRGKS